MNPHRKITTQQLHREEAELLRQIAQVRKALSIMEDNAGPLPLRPLSRAEILRRYLTNHPEGVQVKDLPALLQSLGHVSGAAHQTTNWIYQSHGQFMVTKGIVTLNVTSETDDHGSSDGENAASTGGVNPSGPPHSHNDLPAL